MTERTLFKWVQGITLVLAVGCSVTLLVLWERQQQTNDKLNRQVSATAALARQEQTSLCLAKADDMRAVRSAKLYLKEHPNGTPDFSRAFILSTIAQNEKRAKNLSHVRCPASS